MPPPDLARPTVDDVRGARLATSLAFIASGFAFASWAARIPQVRDRLQLSPSQLGLVLLAIAVGSVLALPLSGPAVARLGSGRTVQLMAALHAVGLVLVAVGYLVGVVPVLVGLFFFGFGIGAWDVAMNVQGAVVERRLERSIMPRFHAGYSVGTVAGALLGSAVVAAHVPVTAHLLVVGALVLVVVPWGVRAFLPDHEPDHEPGHEPDHERGPASDHEPDPGPPGPTDADHAAGPRPRAFAAWTERRTLLVGVFVLAFAFAEGTANDWIGVAVIDGYGTSAAVGTLGFAVFLAAMTAGRWFGPDLLDRYGRVRVVRGLAAVALVGLIALVAGLHVVVAFAGAALWGVGVSLGFPVGMSAGADDPRYAAARVSVVSSIGYCAFLAGPPLVGLLGQHVGVLHALIAVAVMLAVATVLAGVVRPLAPSPSRDG